MIALDLFAGSGWGVACQRLGIEELGVELMPEARATRELAGMRTVLHDVWDGLQHPQRVPAHDMLIASPPCQTFSAAGSGSGRRALGEVLELIERKAHHSPGTQLKQDAAALGMDDRTALVLTPLAYVYRHMPSYIALEQVPSVLPVWEAYAKELHGWGYSVATGILNAEQFGVPQTRKRAFLIAVLDGGFGGLELPKPTHSKYHPRSPQKLDPGVLPWVSMADALGFALTGRPSPTITGGGTTTGGAEPIAKLDRYTSRDDWQPRILRSNYGTGGDPVNRGERAEDQPAPTITSKANRMKWMHERPAKTVTKNGVAASPGQSQHNAERELATGTPMQGWTQPTSEEKLAGRGELSAVRLTPEECAVLQTFPADFPFQGTKTKKHLQIGNAVPPLLAEVVLKHLLS